MEKRVFANMFKRPVSFHRELFDVSGSVNAALWLSQLFYWMDRGENPERWIYKTQAEWTNEVCLSAKEQVTVRKIWKSKGVLEEKLEGIPARLYYRVNLEVLYNLVALSESGQLLPEGDTVHSVEEYLYTESTTESTIHTLVPKKGTAPDCPHDEIISLYHEILPSLPKVRIWTDKRKKALSARWHEDKDRQNLDFWKTLFLMVGKSDFLMGRKAQWRADLEWLVNSSNLVKVIEGKYENREITENMNMEQYRE